MKWCEIDSGNSATGSKNHIFEFCYFMKGIQNKIFKVIQFLFMIKKFRSDIKVAQIWFIVARSTLGDYIVASMFPKPKCSFSLTFMHPLILGLGIILKIEPYLVKIACYIVISLDVGLSTNDNIHKVRQYVSVIILLRTNKARFLKFQPG